MALAICVRCGESKSRGFDPCGACGFDPARADKELQAQSLWLTDEQLTPEALKELGRQLKAGKPLSLDPKHLDSMRRQLQTQQNFALQPKAKMGCSVLVWAALALVVGAAVVFLLSLR